MNVVLGLLLIIFESMDLFLQVLNIEIKNIRCYFSVVVFIIYLIVYDEYSG